MNIKDNQCKTWCDVLNEKGFDSYISESFIGFISWNRGEEFTHLGNEITEILSEHSGKVYAKDVVCSDYNDKGILFFSSQVSDDIANKVFDTLMSYEQNNVYDTLY